jgi:hypothetical protein
VTSTPQDTGILWSDVNTSNADVIGIGSSTQNRLATYADGTGKQLGESPFTIPAVDGASGQILATDGSGNLNWTSASTGDVVGPTGTTADNLAAFDTATGKLIKDAGIAISDVGNVKGPILPTVGNRIAIYSDGTGRALADTLYTIPTNDGGAGQVLTTNGFGVVSWSDTGSGDVEGPASSVGDNIALFDGVTGKLIKDAGKSLSDFAESPGPSIINNVPVFSNTTGDIQDSTISINDINTSNADVKGPGSSTQNRVAIYSDGTGTLIGETAYTIPAGDGTAGQILSTDGAGAVTWTAASTGDVTGPTGTTLGNLASFKDASGKVIEDSGFAVADIGTVKGPVSTVVERVALFDNTTGTQIKQTNYAIPVTDGTINQVLATNGAGVVTWQNNGNGDVTGPGVGTANTAALINGTGQVITRTPYTLPTIDGAVGQVLVTDGGGVTSWSTIAGGDVDGPASAVDQNIATFDGLTGKLIQDSGKSLSDYVESPGASAIDNIATFIDANGNIKDSGIAISDIGDVSGPGAGNTTLNNIAVFSNTDGDIQDSGILISNVNTSNADVVGPGSSTAQRLATYFDGTGKQLGESPFTIPASDGAPGQILATDGSGAMNWTSASTGDVVGPTGTPANNLAAFDGTTGKLIMDSGLAINDVGDVKGPGISTVTNRIAVYADGFGKLLDQTLYEIPTADGSADQVLTTNGLGVVTWQNNGKGDVFGPPGAVPNTVGLFDVLGKNLTASPYTLPTVNGTGGQVLTTDGGGTTSWTTVAGGDVDGPGSAVDQNIATFDGVTGKLIQDSGKSLSDYVESPGASGIDNIATFIDANGNIKDSGIAISDIGDVSGPGTGGSIVDRIATYLDTDGNIKDSGILITDINTSNADVVGPGPTASNRVAIYQDGTGTQLSETAYTIPNAAGTLNRFLQSDGSNTIWSLFSLPNTTGNNNEVLTTDGAGNTSWQPVAGGDVTGPLSSTQDAIALYSDTTGKIIKDSPMTFDGTALTVPQQINSRVFALNDASTGVLKLTAPAAVTDYAITFPASAPGANNKILEANASGAFTWIDTPVSFPTDSGEAGKLILSSGSDSPSWLGLGTPGRFITASATGAATWSVFSFPSSVGTTGQVLTYDTAGNTIWSDFGGGDVSSNTTTSTAGNMATFADGSGKLLTDSGIASDLITLGPVSSGVNNIAVFNNTTGDIGDSTVSVTTLATVGTAGANDVLASFTGNGNEINGSGLLLKSVLRSAGDANPTTVGQIPFNSNAGDNAEVGWTQYSLPANDGTVDQFLQTNGAGVVTWSSFALPATKGLNGQVLVSDGNGLSNWSAIGNGDVVGTTTSTDNNVVVYDGATGKAIRDSNVNFDDLVQSSGASVAGNVPTFSDTDGNIGDSGVPLTSLVQGPGSSTTDNLATFVDGNGNIKDSGIALSEIGDVNGPASSTEFHAAVYDGPTGKLIKQTPYALPNSSGTNGQVLTTDGSGNTTWTTNGTGDVQANLPNTDNMLPAWDGTDSKTLKDSGILISQVNTSNADVVGPGTSTQNAVALFGNTTGDSLFNSNMTYDGTEFIVPLKISTQSYALNGSNSGVLSFTAPADITDYTLTYPATGPTANQILISDGSGNLSWSSVSGGDVVGPASSTGNALAVYDGLTGKLLQDSSVLISEVVTGPVGTADRVALFTGTDTGIKQTDYTIPTAAGTANYVLTTDGSGAATWQANGSGDVSGPGVGGSTTGSVPTFSDTDGNIGDSGVAFSTLVQGPGSSVVDNLATFVDGDGNIKDSGIALSELGDVNGPASSTDFHAAVYDGPTGKLIKQTPYAFPSGNGTNGQVLTTDGSGNAIWATNGTGDVAGAGPVISNNLPMYSDISGKAISDSGIAVSTVVTGPNGTADRVALFTGTDTGLKQTDYTLPTGDGGAGQVLRTDGSGTLTWSSAGTGDVIGPATNASSTIPVWSGVDSKTLADSGILISDINTSTADVKGPGSSNDNALAVWDGVTGTVLQDSTKLISEVVTGPIGTSDRVALFTGTGNAIKETGYTIPTASGGVDQVLTISAAGIATWESNGDGDVSGPGAGNSTQDTIPLFSDSDGNIKDSNLSYDGTTLSGATNIEATIFKMLNGGFSVGLGAPAGLTENYSLTFPIASPTPATDQILQTDGSGQLTWIPTPTGTGDVSTAGAATVGNLAYFSEADGKTIADTLISKDNIVQSTAPGTGNLNKIGILDDVGRRISASAYTMPADSGTANYVLTTDGSGAASWAENFNGNVTGPNPSTASAIPVFDSTDGTSLADSNLLYDDVSSTLSGALSVESQEFQLLSSVSGGVAIAVPGSAVSDYTLTLPDALPASANQILQSDASGNLSWIPTPTRTGEVIGPGSSFVNNIAVFSDTDGKQIADSTISINDVVTGPAANLDDTLPAWDGVNSTKLKDSGVLVASLGDVKGPSGPITPNTTALFDSTGKIISATPYTLPTVNGNDGEVLTIDDLGNTSWQSNPSGDVSSTGPFQINGIALFSDGGGKNLVSTDYRLPIGDGQANEVLTTDGSGNISWTANGMGDLVGPGAGNSIDGRVALFNGTSGTSIKQTDYSFPTADGTEGYVLMTDGAGNVNWAFIPSSGVLEYPYTYNNTTSGGGINTGQVRVNNVDPNLVTEIYAHNNDAATGLNRSSRWMSLVNGDFVQIVSTSSGGSIDWVYEVIGNPTAVGNYSVIPVTVSGVATGTAGNNTSVSTALIYSAIGTGSDERLKKDIKPIESVKEKILDLNPVRYKWKYKNIPDEQLGLIAQEVEKLFPEILRTIRADSRASKNGKAKGLDYSKLVVPLIKAFQEQEEELKEYKEKVKTLEERMERLEKLLLEK